MRNYFVRSNFSATRSEQKRLVLTFNLTLISLVVCVLYIILDVSNDVFYAIPAYVLLFLMSSTSLMLLRWRKPKAAKIILIVTTNAVIFWSAINDPFETGVFLFFIPGGIGSFALLDFAESKTGILLSILTAILFFIAYTFDLRLIDPPILSPSYIKASFILNYFISLTISVAVVYFQMNLNRHSENDLTQKENLANEKNRELQKVNEELDRFVYSVSHDLRSPLSSILGLINIARLSSDTKEVRGILEMIEGRVHSQDHFIREIIDYSRNARTETIIEPIALRQLVEDIFNSVRYLTQAHTITFLNEIPEHFVLMSDKIRLRMILSNLIANAIKYHDPGKEQQWVQVGVEKDTVFVRDNGSGMMPEHLGKIFEMFYRGSDKSTGSGLGLFIAKEAVTKLGGVLSVDSVFREGSTFRVRLPQ